MLAMQKWNCCLKIFNEKNKQMTRQPYFPEHQRKFMQTYLNKTQTMIEWGSGGSTFSYAPLVKEYYSIESNLKWYNKVKSKMSSNVHLFYVSPNEDLNTKLEHTYLQFKDYVDKVHTLGVKVFDIAFIDGRARIHCAHALLPYLTKDSILFFHDFVDTRPWYRTILKEYDCIHMQASLAVLKKHENC